MKKLTAFMCAILLTACSTNKPVENNFLEENITFARSQIGNEIKVIEESGKILSPTTLKPDGSVYYCSVTDWRSGFFPGSVWYLYELSGDSS